MAQERQLPWWLKFLDYTNISVTGATASFLLYTRSVGVSYFAAGAVACSMSVKLVKKAIRQPRPPPMVGARKKVSYGMPSTHSATITYFAVYSTLACAYLPLHPSLPSGWLMRTIPPLVIVPLALLIALSRLWLGHHTIPQVLAGCSYGILFSCTLFALWTHGLSEVGQWAALNFPIIFR
ncbi:PAP2-domain-containing protein [Mucidula mucida]|nr:PAP2-domain-containing protein [Mucidula mucida]